jgi:hypothetical protein
MDTMKPQPEATKPSSTEGANKTEVNESTDARPVLSPIGGNGTRTDGKGNQEQQKGGAGSEKSPEGNSSDAAGPDSTTTAADYQKAQTDGETTSTEETEKKPKTDAKPVVGTPVGNGTKTDSVDPKAAQAVKGEEEKPPAVQAS